MLASSTITDDCASALDFWLDGGLVLPGLVLCAQAAGGRCRCLVGHAMDECGF